MWCSFPRWTPPLSKYFLIGFTTTSLWKINVTVVCHHQHYGTLHIITYLVKGLTMGYNWRWCYITGLGLLHHNVQSAVYLGPLTPRGHCCCVLNSKMKRRCVMCSLAWTACNLRPCNQTNPYVWYYVIFYSHNSPKLFQFTYRIEKKTFNWKFFKFQANSFGNFFDLILCKLTRSTLILISFCEVWN